jgi:all-trans-retinol 13,14-reductase
MRHMTKKISTTALTAEDHAKQDALYAQGHEYDYVIIGTGNAALTVGALLAHAGKKVCMLEAHDIPGGYAQNFKAGDYYFCAQVHYIWGCAPGGKIHSFLNKIGLQDDITFELFDKKGYDHMSMPDGKTVNIPYGFDKLVNNIDDVYPGNRKGLEKFVGILKKMRDQMGKMPTSKIGVWDVLTTFWKVPTIIKYRKATLQDVFDECQLSKEAQAVLCANAGDFMLPPERLSFIMYVALFGGYNVGAYYPTKHFKYYIDRVAEFIQEHDGCHIYYETEVSKDQCWSCRR